MDEPSQSVVQFLGVLQGAMQQLAGIWGHYQRRGAEPGRPALELSGRPFTIEQGTSARSFHGCIALRLPIRGAGACDYELSVNILWDDAAWTITTEAWRDLASGEQDLLRELPERSAADLEACLEHVRLAVADLAGFEDLVPGRS